ncbi:MAG: tetratricopeptide repeat protein [Planctomycetota bacterium]
MEIKRHGVLLAVVLCFSAGCVTQTVRPISEQVITDDEEGRSTIVDVKLEKYQRLAKEFPTNPRYQERLARLYWEKSDHVQALKSITRAKKIDPGNPRYDFLAGQVYEGIGHYTAAEKSYLSMLEDSDEDKYSGPLFQLALLYIQMERIDKAVTYLEKSLEIDPTFPEPHYWLGRILMMQRNRPDAILSFERYLRVGGTSRQQEVLQTLQALQPDMRIHKIR